MKTVYKNVPPTGNGSQNKIKTEKIDISFVILSYFEIPFSLEFIDGPPDKFAQSLINAMVSSSSKNLLPNQANVQILEGFSGLPSPPATGLSSLPAYNPVDNGGVALGHTPPVSHHNGVGPITTVTRQNGVIPSRHLGQAPPPPPPPVTRHNTSGVDSQSPLRQNGGPPIIGRMNVTTTPISRNHEQYSRNWPPNSQNQMDMHHVKKVKH